MAVLSMSKQEFSRLDMLLRVHSGRLRVTDACELIGLQRRQVFRLLRGLKQDGATSLLSKRRGRPSNHRPPAEVRALTLSIVRERYSEFGPSLAKEKLAEHPWLSGVARDDDRVGILHWRDARHWAPAVPIHRTEKCGNQTWTPAPLPQAGLLHRLTQSANLRLGQRTKLSPTSLSSVSPAAPNWTAQVWSPTMPSAAT